MHCRNLLIWEHIPGFVEDYPVYIAQNFFRHHPKNWNSVVQLDQAAGCYTHDAYRVAELLAEGGRDRERTARDDEASMEQVLAHARLAHAGSLAAIEFAVSFWLFLTARKSKVEQIREWSRKATERQI